MAFYPISAADCYFSLQFVYRNTVVRWKLRSILSFIARIERILSIQSAWIASAAANLNSLHFYL
jgi:hypothetical protein